MKIKVLGSFGSEGVGQRPSAFLVDDRVLVDAGTVGGALSVAEQIEIQFALISHAHLDHTAGLAFLTDTLAMVAADRRVTACSIAPVIEALRTHAFNDALRRELRKDRIRVIKICPGIVDTPFRSNVLGGVAPPKVASIQRVVSPEAVAAAHGSCTGQLLGRVLGVMTT